MKVGKDDGVDAVGGEGVADGGVGRGRGAEALHQGNLARGVGLVGFVSIIVIQGEILDFGGVYDCKRDVGEKSISQIGCLCCKDGKMIREIVVQVSESNDRSLRR